MRTPDGRLIADLNDRIPALVTGSVAFNDLSSINENDTQYSLLPEKINAKPYVSGTIYDLSTPQIKAIQYNNEYRLYMYHDDQGTIRVAEGTDFVLRFKGMQPPVDNVENGRLITYQNQNALTYEWDKDGANIFTVEDPTRPNSAAIIGGDPFGSQLTFTNVSRQHSGIYTCTVANDIGSTTSETIYLDVVSPDQDPMFYRNLVENPNGASSVDQWQGDSEFVAGRLSNAPFINFSQPWKTDLFGYSKDMFYPRPYHLNTYHIRNSDLERNISQDGYYFTREKYTYAVNDGKAIVTATQDVDLTEIKDYIQGAVYGIEGVRAVFGCYIGNAVTKFKVTVLNALITKRSTKYTLLPNRARLDIVNMLLSGVPEIFEKVNVSVQEFSEETPLLSKVDGNMVPGYDMSDEWTKVLNKNYVPEIIQEIDDVIKTYAPDAIISPWWAPAKIAHIVKNNYLYPSDSYSPVYGQYVKFNRFVIDKLNFNTTKIRITVTFTVDPYIIEGTENELITTGDVFEKAYEWIVKPLHFPDGGRLSVVNGGGPDYYISQSNPVSVAYHNQVVFGVKPEDPYGYSSVIGAPRGMVTGFNLITFPIETKKPNKTEYYTKTLLSQKQGENVRAQDLTYPELVTGRTPTNALSLYMSTLNTYTSSIVYVDINNWDRTHAADAVDQYFTQGASTLTTVTTYRYKTNQEAQDQQLNLTNDKVWEKIPLNKLDYFNPSSQKYNSSTNIKILYNKQPSDIVAATIPQVIGNVSTNLRAYIGTLITEVPGTFATASSTRGLYNPSIGFDLALRGDDYGVDVENNLTNKTDAEKKQMRFDGWKQLNGSQGSAGKLTYRCMLRNNIANVTQTLTYNGSTYNAVVKNHPTHKVINLESNFTFKKDNYFEKDHKVEDEQPRLLEMDYRRYLQYINNGNGGSTYYWPSARNVNEKLQEKLAVAKQVIYDISGTKMYSGIGSTRLNEVYHDDRWWWKGYINQYGKTQDMVALESATTAPVIDGLPGVSTPAAIIIPDKQEIIYFVYSWQSKKTESLVSEVKKYS